MRSPNSRTVELLAGKVAAWIVQLLTTSTKFVLRFRVFRVTRDRKFYEHEFCAHSVSSTTLDIFIFDKNRNTRVYILKYE